MSRWFDHLRLKVLAFGIAMSVLPLAIYGWYGLTAARSSQMEIVQAQNEAAARIVAEELSQFLRQITTQLELVARLEGGGLVSAPQGQQERVLYTLLRDVRYLEDLSLVDSTGREISRASRREVVGGQDPRLYGGSLLWQGVLQGQSVIGDVTVDIDGRPIFTVGVPLPEESGALIARPTLRGLVDNIATVQSNGSVRIHVIDESGRLIGDSDFSLVLAGHRLEALADGSSQDEPYRSITGEQAIGYRVSLADHPWQVVAETTVAAAMAPVRRLAWESVGGALILMALVVGLSIVFGLQLTIPLERLERGARRVGEGDLGVRIPEGGRDELGRLVTAFNGMTGRLQEQDRRLRAERDRLDTAVSAIGAGMALIDPEGRILWVNRRLAEWFPGAQPGARCWESLGRTSCTGVCRNEGGEERVIIGGRERLLRYRNHPLKGAEAGEPARLEVLEDVTERRAMEQVVLQSEKLAAVGQLAAGVAHEINNPLAVISAYAEDLSDRLKEEGAAALEAGGELDGYLQQLQVQVRRCKGITANLLDFARRGPDAPEPVDVAAVARATASLVTPQARKVGVSVSVESPEGLPPVRARRDQLQQVFLNLITNALDAMEEPGSGQVKIMVEPVASPGYQGQEEPGAGTELPGLRVTVIDDGAGMDRETCARALEPFFTTKPPGKGTGLGLSMCYGIITGLGGQMGLESQPAVGTQVWFELPLWDAVERGAVRPARGEG